MAKLKAPLLSLGAAGQLGKAIVYFPWKGLDVVREYVIPANPQTAAQNLQRAYLREAVKYIHEAQAHATHPLDETDTSAYALLGSTRATPRTWFNEAVKSWIDQRVDAAKPTVFRAGATVEGSGQLAVTLDSEIYPATAGNFHYGTSKTALINTKAATVAGSRYTATITGLTNGIKYFWQFRPTAAADRVGQRSGIYYGTPSA